MINLLAVLNHQNTEADYSFIATVLFNDVGQYISLQKLLVLLRIFIIIIYNR